MSTLCGPPQIKISWSALQAHELCRQKAKLYRERHKSPATNIRPFFHGIVADRTCRRWLDSDDPRPGEMASWVPEMVESCLTEARDTGDGVLRWKHSADRRDMTEWVIELVTRLELFLLRDVIPYEYQAEYKFRVPIRIPDLTGNLAEILLTGGMDILVREAQGPPAVWAGYDLKATENPDYIRKTLGQGIFYSLAHFAAHGDRFRTFAFIQPMVEENPVAHVIVSDAEIASLMSRVVKMAHDIWRGDFAPKESMDGCGFCSVKHACSRFKPSSKTTFSPKKRVRNV